jgi:hypothetical protein
VKIDFTQKLKTLSGTNLKASDAVDAADVTLQDVTTNALLVPNPDTKDFNGHAAAFKLALRISNTPTGCDLSREEVLTITRAVGRVYGPAVCGPVDILFDGQETAT